MNGKCYTFKGQNLENGLSYISQAIGNTLGAKAIDTQVKVKETDPIWTQICSSLLQIQLW